MLESKHRFDTSLSMSLGILLVVNSHLEGFHPRPWLAGDGLLGNYIFFFLSGLRISSGQSRHCSFVRYANQRIMRIYPAVWIATAAHALAAGSAFQTTSFFHTFVWPTNYTYVAWILPFYAVLFFILRSGLPTIVGMAVVSVCLWLWSVLNDHSNIQTLSDIPTVIQVSGYFSLFLAGSMASIWPPKKTAVHWLAPLGLTAFYILAKYLIVTSHTLSFYPLIYSSGAFAAVVLCVYSGERDFALRFKEPAIPRRIIHFLSSHSLEIYVTHSLLLHVAVFRHLPYPLNVATLLVFTFAASAVLKLFTDKLVSAAGR